MCDPYCKGRNPLNSRQPITPFTHPWKGLPTLLRKFFFRTMWSLKQKILLCVCFPSMSILGIGPFTKSGRIFWNHLYPPHYFVLQYKKRIITGYHQAYWPCHIQRCEIFGADYHGCISYVKKCLKIDQKFSIIYVSVL